MNLKDAAANLNQAHPEDTLHPLYTPWGELLMRSGSYDDILSEYPRPQMRRTDYHMLNGLWEYAFVPADGIPVILLHLMRNGWRTLPGAFTALFPQTPSGWVDLFGMDTVRTRIFHEWHRAGTALFLHADAQHLTGNCVFAALFLWFLSRAAGPGWAMLVTVLGGTLGYCAEALLRTAPAVSIGFSTALFAAVGALSGLMSLHSRALAVPPLAAGAALLAMLGTEGENTDYMAHICANW